MAFRQEGASACSLNPLVVLLLRSRKRKLEAMRIEFVPGKGGPPELSLALAGHVASL